MDRKWEIKNWRELSPREKLLNKTNDLEIDNLQSKNNMKF